MNQKLNQNFYRSNFYRSNSYYRSKEQDFRKTYERSTFNDHLIFDRDSRSIKLRFANIMKFDSKKNFAIFFIRRFYHIAEIEEEQVVLRILSMCLCYGTLGP